MKKKYLIVIIVLVFAIALFFIIKNKGQVELNYEIEEVKDFNYFLLKEKEKYGVIDKEGKTIIQPKYDEVKIPNPEKEVFICYEQNTSVVLNAKGEEIFTEYKEVEPVRLKNIISNLMYEKSVLTYKKDGKMGLIDFNGKKIGNCKYESIETLPYQEGKLLVKQEGKVGVINIKGYQLVECNYDKVEIDEYYEEDNGYKYAGYKVLNTTEEGYRYGYINYEGKEIIKTECNELSRVTEIKNKNDVYLILAKNGQYGVYKNQNEIIKNEYQSIRYEQKNQVFVIEKSRKYGISDINGKMILPVEYDQIDITGICIYAKKGQETKVFDKQGKEMQIDENMSILNTDNENYKIALKNENGVFYGVINNNNETLIPQNYNYIEYLYDNYFIALNKEGKLGILNDKGEEVLEFKYNSLQRVEETDIIKAGITKAQEEITEFYSSKLQKICEEKNPIIGVKDGYIYVEGENETKYINIKTEQEEENIKVFKQNKLFAKKENGKWGFVDVNQNTKIESIYDKVTEFNQYGFAGIKKEGKWGVVNSEGEVILQPTYEIKNETNLNFIGEYYSVEYGFGEIYYTNGK